jgi:cytochrome b561
VIPIGILMNDLSPGALQDRLFNLHRSLGTLILALAILRVLMRWIGGVPAPHPGLTRFQRVASELAHRSIIVLIVAVPLLGWAASSAYRAPVLVFGLFELPPILPANRRLAEILFEVHTTAAFLTAGILCVHVGAALWHGVIMRDGVLSRMLPARWR